MGGIDEELHLLFVHLLCSMTTIGNYHIDSQRDKQDEIDEICQHGAIPGSSYRDDYHLLRRVATTQLSTHLKPVVTRLEMTQRNLVDTHRVGNPFTIIDAILENHITGIIKIHLRETQRDGVIQIAKREMIALANRLFRDTNAIKYGSTGNNGITYQHTRQL